MYLYNYKGSISMKKILVLAFLVAFSLAPGLLYSSDNRIFDDERVYTRARITEIKRIPVKEGGISTIETSIYLKILDGELKGQTKTAVFKGRDDLPRDMNYKKGNIVFVGISTVGSDDPVEYISLYDIDNTSGIIIMSVLLLLSIILIGRFKGLFSLLSLIITILLLFFVFIPLTLKGYPPLPIAIAISIISIIITLPIIAGIRLKTLSAIIGASAGVIIASLLAVFFGWIMHLSGIVSNEMLTVFYTSTADIDLRSIALSGMIIAALGAVMDVCISIASSTQEIFNANPAISEKEALKSVLNIGTDILASMVNTLILAYVGSSLSLILLISMRFDPGMPLWMIFNHNPVLSELVKSAVGSIGMFLCVPITAIVAVKLFRKKAEKATV